MKKKDRVAQALRRATRTIEDAGWTVTDTGRRLVASKAVIEDDHSVTKKYESAFGVEALAVVVSRREREAAASNVNRRDRT
jgi:hypothetical protein